LLFFSSLLILYPFWHQNIMTLIDSSTFILRQGAFHSSLYLRSIDFVLSEWNSHESQLIRKNFRTFVEERVKKSQISLNQFWPRSNSKSKQGRLKVFQKLMGRVAMVSWMKTWGKPVFSYLSWAYHVLLVLQMIASVYRELSSTN
jgi:hypothetical protein